MTRLPPKPSWAWARFDQIASVDSNLVDPADYPDYPHIAPNHIESGTGRLLEYATIKEDGVTSPKHLFKAGHILYSKIRPYLAKAVLVDFEGLCSADMYPVSTTMDARFLHQWIVGQDFTEQASRRQGRTVLPKINQAALNALFVPVPPRNEQRRIVARIEKLQARSRAARESLEAIPPLLERFRQSVLAAAFRGDLTADWRRANPDVEPASVLLERIRVERRRRWEEAELERLRAKGREPKDDKWKAKYREPEPVDTTGLPALPEGWVWAAAGELGHVQLGRQRSPKNHTGDNMVAYLRAANVTWSGLGLDDVKQMNFSPEEVERYCLLDGDILLGEASGSRYEVGKPAIWRGELPVCCFQNTLIRVRSTLSELVPFLYWHFFYNAFSGGFGDASKGTGIHHIGAQNLERWPVRLPPLEEQTEVVARLLAQLDRLDHVSSALEEATDRPSVLESSVLAKAFRGELVPQDPADEPATLLVDHVSPRPVSRLRAE